MRRIDVIKSYEAQSNQEAKGTIPENYATQPQLLFSRRMLQKERFEDNFDITNELPEISTARKGWCNIL